MNSCLIQSSASVDGPELRAILLAALNATHKAYIPRSGMAPGTESNAGKQICQLLYSGTQAQIESDLQNAGLQPHKVVGFQSFKDEYQGNDVNGDPIYVPTVSTSIEAGTLQYLKKRYEPDGTTELPPNVNWFPSFKGKQSDWVSA